MAEGLERTMGELLGKLDMVLPALTNLEKISSEQGRELGEIRLKAETATDALAKFKDEIRHKLENGWGKRLYDVEAKASITSDKVKVIEEDRKDTSKTLKDRLWDIAMLLLASSVGSLITALIFKLIEAHTRP